MIAANIQRETLEYAAESIGVTLDMSPQNKRGDRWRVKVNPGNTKDRNGDRKYQRISVSPFNHGRRVAAVCWHGFRDFFRACFEQEPDAIFRTGLDTWNGSDDFESRYRESGNRECGAPIMPARMCDACTCPESGVAE